MTTMMTKMSKNSAILVKIRPGDHPDTIAAKLAQVPNEFWLTHIKEYPTENVTVMFFVCYEERTIDELLDSPIICNFSSKIIE